MANNNNNDDDLFIVRPRFRGNNVNVEKIDDYWNLFAKDKDGTIKILSNRYGWSEHNCQCKDSKTGLILYPNNVQYKNIVLLVCQNCYKYKKGNETQHGQLWKWYQKIYPDKSFVVISGFCQQADGTLGYNSSTYNEATKYGDGTRIMNELEQKIVQEVVTNKHHTYNVVKAISQDPSLFKCTEGHALKLSVHKDRKNEKKEQYPNEGFFCNTCNTRYSSGVSWHCSLHPIGFDKCRKCVSSKG